MFDNRADAARRLAKRLAGLPLKSPLVLGIPHGGVVIAATLARALDAELDVVLARKLRAPWQPEIAIGALGEDGCLYLNELAAKVAGATPDYLVREREDQDAEIRRRRQLFRAHRPPADAAGRSLIVTDDGVATGSTMLAALHVLRSRRPAELIVAVPVASPQALARLAPHCDRIECLLVPPHFNAAGEFYGDFAPLDDEEVVRLMRNTTNDPARRCPDTAR